MSAAFFAALAADDRSTTGMALLWRSRKDGTPANGGASDPVLPGDVHELPGPIPSNCGSGALHATLKPQRWKGERLWAVALHGEVRGDEEKYWGLKREIIADLGPADWLP